MTPASLMVRCMARQEDGVWVAVCLDFSLAAQGVTLEQARARLQEQISVYVKEACTIDRQHADVLLSRRAPLGDRLTWAWCSFKAWIGLALRKCVYREALPLQPA